MGCTSSSGKHENKTKPTIDDELGKDQLEQSRIHKLLLLGAGEAGKSTFFNQIVMSYGEGIDDESRIQKKPVIQFNLFHNMNKLIEAIESPLGSSLGLVLSNGQDDLAPAIRHVRNVLGGTENINAASPQYIRALWKHPSVQRIFQERSKFYIYDSAEYFFERAIEICDPDQIPTEEDVLRVRVMTTAMVETRFTLEDEKFLLVDIGGQRSERKKWMNCFDNVTAVLFVIAIGAYDMNLFEDVTVNRMCEDLELFERTINNDVFKDTPIIVFMNKDDLFRDKITRGVPLTIAFPEYSGDNSYEDALRYVEDKIKERNKNPKRMLSLNVTCMTDTRQVRAIFQAVKNIVVENALNIQTDMPNALS